MTYAKVNEKGNRLIDGITNKGGKEKFQIAQYFLKNHFNSRDGLKEIGVVRTNKLAHAEYAEWLVAKLLNGTLPKSSVNKGFDVEVLKNKKKIKKSIRKRDGNGRFKGKYFSSQITFCITNCKNFFNLIKPFFEKIKQNMFYFILYLCALEISPYVILYKLII